MKTRPDYLKKRGQWYVLVGLASAALVATTNSAHAAVAISTAGSVSDSTNYGPSGLDIGTQNIGDRGFWFANFGASSPVTGAPVDQDDYNALPGWMSVQFNPIPAASYSFAPSATSTGGQTGYNNLTLPDSTLGLSGQLVDNLNSSVQQSNTITTRWTFGPGAPSSLYISVVLDNIGSATPPDGPTTVQRLRMSNFAADLATNQQATFDNLAAGANGIADVYTFKLTGVEVGGYFTVQLRTNGNVAGTADTALAGYMFTAIPEPSSVLLLGLGAVGLGVAAARRRKR